MSPSPTTSGSSGPSAEEALREGVDALEQRRVGAAVAALERAVALAPGRADCAAQLARALALAHRLPEALAVASRAVRLQAQNALSLDTLGVVHSRANDHARAAELFGRAAEIEPDNAGYQFNLASSLKFLGRFDEADAAYEACIAAAPHHWKAHSALSQLRRQTPEGNHVARLQALLPETGGDVDAHLHLQLALAKEYEDLGDRVAAFRSLAAGKSAKRRTLSYTTAEDEALFTAMQAAFAAPVVETSEGAPSTAPIFVFGMPRTGTTLVERILSSHSQVVSAGELQAFGVAVKRAAGTASQRVLDVETIAAAQRADMRAIGEAYLLAASPAAGRRLHFIDKMPLNFFYAGFIARALPGARMICLRRNPLDTCLANFRQLFALNLSYYNYAWDLLDCARYYVLFDRLMAHWQRVLPGRVLEVAYEKLVMSQADETRRLLAFCDLPWEDACLRFEQNPGAVATASAVQVRQPLYQSSVNRWRRYASELAGVRELLVAAGVAVEVDRP